MLKKYSSLPCFNVLSRNAGIIAIVNSKDDNLCQFSSFNYEIQVKNSEVTKNSLFFLKLFKTHSLSYARQHRVKWMKGIRNFLPKH